MSTTDDYSEPSEPSSSESPETQQQSQTQPQVVTKKAATRTTAKSKVTTAALATETVAEVVTHEVLNVDELTSKGIAAADLNKLKEAGIYTVQAITMQTHKQLCNIKGISEAKVDKILQACQAILGPKQFLTAEQVLQKRKNLLRISTGSKEFDQMLGGFGMESQQIVELFGEFRSGKSQICHTMAVTAQHPIIAGKRLEESYKVIYIDTEATFRPERLQQIAKRFGYSEKEVFNNVVVSRVYTHEQQIQAISYLPAMLSKSRFSAIIIDSLTALFRADFSGRGELADRQQRLGKHLSSLLKLAEEYNLLIIVTNQVMATVDGAAMFTADPKKPVGGHVLAHASTTRLSLRKGRGDTRVAKIYDSPLLPEAEATFQISDGGVCDVTE